MRVVLLGALLLGCGNGSAADGTRPAPASPTPPSDPPAETARDTPTACTLALSSDGAIRLQETAVDDLEPETIAPILGAPDRLETTRSRGRYEKHGPAGERSSTMVVVEARHVVYDEQSITLETRSSPPTGRRGAVLRLFFENARQFDNVAAPEVVPRRRGGCAVTIDGHLLETSDDLVDDEIDSRTGEVTLAGVPFAVTSYGGIVDRLYVDTPGYRLMVFLDEGAQQRPAYIELTRRAP